MKSSPQTQEKIVFGRVCLPWTDQETAALAGLCADRATKEELLAAAPGRSLASIRTKLAQLRGGKVRSKDTDPRKLYLVASQRTPLLDRDAPPLFSNDRQKWRRRCMIANAKFLAAVARVQATA